jgi:hypothetical protein
VIIVYGFDDVVWRDVDSIEEMWMVLSYGWCALVCRWLVYVPNFGSCLKRERGVTCHFSLTSSLLTGVKKKLPSL